MQGEELDTFLGPPFGVLVECGSVSSSGIFDEPGSDVAGVAISTDRSVLVRTDEFESVAVYGTVIMIDGTDYKVRTFQREAGDGALARIVVDGV
jgi:hypothetical protein